MYMCVDVKVHLRKVELALKYFYIKTHKYIDVLV